MIAQQEAESEEALENPFPVTDGDDEPPLTAEDLFAAGAAEPTDQDAEDAALESDAR